jgi:SAM-dependent methyltransferase
MGAPNNCIVCGGDNNCTFFRIDDQPVLIGVLWPEPGSARACDRGDIELSFCRSCGFVWNSRFDPSKLAYDQQYDNSLHFSGTFQRYTEGVVKRLVHEHDLNGKVVVDIGCGKGDFLRMLCAAGGNTGYGFDPSYEGDRATGAADERIVFHSEFFSIEHAQIPAQLIVSRFVLEHIPDPRAFLGMLRQALAKRPETVLYFEVPNVELIVRQGSVWDVIYEHCSYFGPESLARIFVECGFEVLRVDAGYAGQFVSIEARVGSACATLAVSPFISGGSRLVDDIKAFSSQQLEKRGVWEDRLSLWHRDGISVAAWGAGAKAVGFFNMLSGSETVDRIVDINPFKQGKFLAGTGQEIVAPEELVQSPPDKIILMNHVYRDEIAITLAGLGLRSELVDA